MRPDGSDVRRLTSNTLADIDPAYSPDGSRIAFASARSSSAVVIHTMNADGTNVRRLLFTGAQSHSPSWSPDGANIAFMDGSRGLFDITRVNVNTGALTPLTATFAIDGLPAWSPDGTKIAFDHSGTPPPFPGLQIYVMGAIAGEAAGKTPLTSGDPGDNSFGANWSPDGTRITFQTDRDGNNEIYTMKSDGTDLRRLTSNATNVPGTEIDESDDSEPAYSPDGKAIVFQSARSGDYEVYTMNAASGGSVTRLTNTPGRRSL